MAGQRHFRPTQLLLSEEMSPTLAGINEVAEILGVTVRTAYRRVSEEGFPEPIDDLAAGRIWERSAVEAWAAKATLPRRGRPPKDT